MSPIWYRLLTRRPAPVVGYAAGALAATLAVGATWTVARLTGLDVRSIALVGPITAAVAWGLGPALLASIVSAVGLELLVLHGPVTVREVLDHPEVLVRLLVYASITGTLASLVSSMRTAVAHVDRYRLEAERVARDLVALAVHDLKGPLSGLVLGAQLVEREVAAGRTDRLPSLLERHQRALTGMRRLVDDLQDAVRIDLGQFTLEPKACDVAEVLATGVAPWVPQAEVQGVTLEAPEPEARATVPCDRVDRVFGNLLGNALKHVPAGSRVEVRTYVQPDEVRFEVVDQGPGIPEPDRAHLFEAYWHGGTSKGTGLGLFLAKGIVEAHGGTITLTDSGPHGSTFTFTLPRKG